MALDLTTFDDMLKSYYTDDRVMNMVYEDNALLALIPKFESFKGKNLPIPIQHGIPQGRSASFARAQARGDLTTVGVESFVLTHVRDYSIATIDNLTIAASEGDDAAFMEASTATINGAIHSLKRSIAQKMYGGGWGIIGSIGSTSGSTITLAAIEDIVNFEVGMELVFADNATDRAVTPTDDLRDSGDSLLVAGVNRSTGVITTTAAVSGIASIANGDYIYVRGDRSTTASGIVRQVIAGLEAWVPAVAPTSVAFFGADRSVDPTRLGGQRYDGTAKPIEEVLIEGAAITAREGQSLSHYMMPFSQYSSLEKALGAKVQYVNLKVTPEIGFTAVVINGPRGPIKVVPDFNCPSDRIFGLKMDTWKLYTTGKAVRVIDTDGLQMLRQAASDGVEVRYGMYGNMGCRAPGANINIQR